MRALSIKKFFIFVLTFFALSNCVYYTASCYANSHNKCAKWETIDIPVKTIKKYDNPYTEVKIFGSFKGPNNHILTVNGFWDGGDSFVVRFTPTVEGLWHYSINAEPEEAIAKQAGTLTVSSENAGRGFLRRDSEHKKSFVFDNDERYLMVGQTYYELLRKTYSKENWKISITKSKQYGFNKIRMLLWVWNSKKNYYPKIYPFKNNDLDSIDPGYFQKFDEIIKYMNSQNIVADVILFREGKGRLNYPIQQINRYLNYAIARYAAFTNVIWTLVNEWESSDYSVGREWFWDAVGDMVKKQDPWHSEDGFLRPLSIHQVTYPYFKWAGSDWPVHAIIQYGVWNGLEGKWSDVDESVPRFAYGDQWGNFSIVCNLGLNLPIVNDEFGYFGQRYTHKGITVEMNRENLRRAMWSIYLAGGYGSMGDDSTGYRWPEKITHYIRESLGMKSQLPRIWSTGDWNYIPVYEDVKRMVDFWKDNDIPYWEMSSRNSIVKKGDRVYVLSNDKDEMVAYSSTGAPFTLKLPQKKFLYKWFAPKTGKSDTGMIKINENYGTFSPPFDGDVVLYLHAAS